MKISIIIPVFNKIEIIEQCIALNIEHADLMCEWIIIDNASDAPTKEGLKRLQIIAQQKGHHFDIVNEISNTGVAVAWNKGLTLASQDYICILNNDCVMMPGWCTALIKTTLKADLFSPLVIENGHLNKPFHLHDFIKGIHDWKYLLRKNSDRFREGYFSGIVLFAKRSIFDKIGPFDEQFWLSMEDIDYQYRATRNKFKIGLTGSCVAYHYSSLTRKNVLHNEEKNQQHFFEKWGWNYAKHESNTYNKFIRSLSKLIMKKLHIMLSTPQKFPL